MKPEMKDAITKVENTMKNRAKTPCVRKQLKGEKETALVKRGVGNASKHAFGKQDHSRRTE